MFSCFFPGCAFGGASFGARRRGVVETDKLLRLFYDAFRFRVRHFIETFSNYIMWIFDTLNREKEDTPQIRQRRTQKYHLFRRIGGSPSSSLIARLLAALCLLFGASLDVFFFLGNQYYLMRRLGLHFLALYPHRERRTYRANFATVKSSCL